MNKKALLALMLVLTMLLSSCSLVVKNAEVDAATPIVTVNDKVYTKAEVQSYVTSYLNSIASQYSQYGYSYDTTSADNISSAQDYVISYLTEEAVKEQKMAEWGLDTLTEEEQASVDEEYQSWYDLVAGMITRDESMTDEEYQEEVEYYVYYFTGSTKESLVASMKEDKLKNEAVKDVVVTDEEIQAEYESRVEEAKTSYESDLSAYGEAVNDGETVYYRPAGYRMVKNLLIKLTDADNSLIDGLNSKATEQSTAMSTAKSAVEAVEGADLEALAAQVTVSVEQATTEAAEEGTVVIPSYAATVTDTFDPTDDEATATLQQNVRDYVTAQALYNAYTEAAAKATEDAYANIAPKADELLARLDAGEDFDTVMAENTEDTGMQGDSTTAKNGYAVCEGFSSFDSAFVEAAMAIPAVGGHSDKTRGSYGYYIIGYASEVTEGAVDLADVKDVIQSELLSDKQDEAYTAAVEQWISEAKVVTDKKSLNDND